MQFTSIIFLSLCISLSTLPAGALASDVDSGPLDRPLPFSSGDKPGKPGVTTTSLGPLPVRVNNPAQALAQLRAAVASERKELERLPRAALLQRARKGERAAQVVLGADFAREASLLAFAPAAANAALSDAVRWYSLAASRGFPGAPSLDLAGVRYYPVRIQRNARR
ncbi:MAG: hypothetical protein HKN42_10800 [Granulosicoccus sp.]|nr:hypothetical protein [Granulosicoccus sp.]